MFNFWNKIKYQIRFWRKFGKCQTIHVCLLFKLFMYAYCSNYSCMPTVQTIHVCLLFKLFMSVRLRLLQYKLRLTKCTSKLIIWLGVAHLLLIFSVMFSFVCLPSSHRVLYWSCLYIIVLHFLFVLFCFFLLHIINEKMYIVH